MDSFSFMLIKKTNDIIIILVKSIPTLLAVILPNFLIIRKITFG